MKEQHVLMDPFKNIQNVSGQLYEFIILLKIFTFKEELKDVRELFWSDSLVPFRIGL